MLKINYTQNINNIQTKLPIKSMKKVNNEVHISLYGNLSHGLIIGDNITFKKWYIDNGNVKYLTTSSVEVVDIIDDSTFVISDMDVISLNITNEESSQIIGKVLSFNDYHNILPNDLIKYAKNGDNQDFIISDISNNIIVKKIKNINNYNEIIEYDENYLPDDVNLSKLYIETNNSIDVIRSVFLFPFNMFYFIDNRNECILFDNVEIIKENIYYNIPLTFSVNEDFKYLNNETNLKCFYNENVKPNIIPEIINMEKVKCKPLSYDNKRIDEMIFNLHFRERKMGDIENGLDKEWYISDNNKYWNGINGFNDINKDNISISDAIGYLGFTEDDIKYQKLKLKKSFLRLSFYDSKDPLTQNLLFYSTIFMDSGKLYGKYIKLLKESKKNNTSISLFDNESIEEKRLSSQFIVRDEYDITKSSEGFNIYLFEDDMPLKNNENDIYLKIEFNHAGYGRTIPFVLLKEGNQELTINNYFDYLYIGVKIIYNDSGYYYVVPNATNEGNCLVFNLFEPLLKSE